MLDWRDKNLTVADLAGLGGALQIPFRPAQPAMDIAIISETFVVTVVGGMGSIPGAFLAAVAIGLLQAFGALLIPKSVAHSGRLHTPEVHILFVTPREGNTSWTEHPEGKRRH